MRKELDPAKFKDSPFSDRFLAIGIYYALIGQFEHALQNFEKAREYDADGVITASIIAATAVMYLRLIVVSFAFNASIAKSVLLPFVLFALLGFAVAFFYSRGARQKSTTTSINISEQNPLDLNILEQGECSMRALVVYCHPNPGSYNAAVRDIARTDRTGGVD